MLIPVLIILAAIVLTIALVVIVVARKPGEFRITRSATLPASAAVVFAQVNDFHLWRAWSPWERLDPAMQRTYEGSPAGLGAIYRWTGNKQVGQGNMTIIDSQAGQLIRIAMVFLKPFASTGTAEFVFTDTPTATGDQTTVVTWSMSGSNNLMCKMVGLFMNMDKLVGSQFEEGLRNLTAVVKSLPKQA